MSDDTILSMDEACEAIYLSLANDNADIDFHIANLKAAMTAEGQKEAIFSTSHLPHNNRSGRKMMQSYFKKRGVKVVFEE